MKESRKPRARNYARIPRNIYTDPRLLEVSGLALTVLLTLIVFAAPSDEQTIGGQGAPDVGWVLTETGAPASLRRLAILVRRAEDDVVEALDQLAVTGVVAESDGGAWGIVGWRLGIGEDPGTERVRRLRKRRAA